MPDRYISREWLLRTLGEYKRPEAWNLDVLDGDTVQRTLEVVENLVKGAPDIGSRKLGNTVLKVKNAALSAHKKMLEREIEESAAGYRKAETVGNVMLMGFYKGLKLAREEVYAWLERMVDDE